MNVFYSILFASFHHFAPLVQVRATRPPAPWLTITENLRRLIRMRRSSLSKFRRSANHSHRRGGYIKSFAIFAVQPVQLENELILMIVLLIQISETILQSYFLRWLLSP